MDPLNVAEGDAREVQLGNWDVWGLDVDSSGIILELVHKGTEKVEGGDESGGAKSDPEEPIIDQQFDTKKWNKIEARCLLGVNVPITVIDVPDPVDCWSNRKLIPGLIHSPVETRPCCPPFSESVHWSCRCGTGKAQLSRDSSLSCWRCKRKHIIRNMAIIIWQWSWLIRWLLGTIWGCLWRRRRRLSIGGYRIYYFDHNLATIPIRYVICRFLVRRKGEEEERKELNYKQYWSLSILGYK